MEPWPTDGKEDGFTDRPVPPAPPWELPGNFRRDCEPHRAGLLRLLGVLAEYAVLATLYAAVDCAAVIGLQSYVPASGLEVLRVVGLFAALALPGVCLGGLAWWLARKDLARMRRGLVDPGGERLTRDAGRSGAVGALLSALASAFVAAVVLASPLARPYLGL
jgi:hypothetical protein